MFGMPVAMDPLKTATRSAVEQTGDEDKYKCACDLGRFKDALQELQPVGLYFLSLTSAILN